MYLNTQHVLQTSKAAYWGYLHKSRQLRDFYFMPLVSHTDGFSSALEEEAEVGRGLVGDCFSWGKPWLVAFPFNICLLSDANIMTNTLGCCWKEEARAHQSLPSRELKLFCASSEV